MKTAMYWIVTGGSILMGMRLGGFGMGYLFQPTAFLFVLAPTMAYLLLSLGLSGVSDFFKRLLAGNLNENDFGTIERCSTMGFLLGTLGAILGMTFVMGHLTSSQEMGTGLATSMVSALYGVLPALLLNIPIGGKKNLQAVSRGDTMKKAATFFSFTVLFLLGSFFLTLYALK